MQAGADGRPAGDGYGLVLSETSFVKACRGADLAIFTQRIEMPSRPVEAMRQVPGEPIAIQAARMGSTPPLQRRQGLRAMMHRLRTRLERKLKKALMQSGILDLIESALREIRTLRLETQSRFSRLETQHSALAQQYATLEQRLAALVPVRTAYGYVAVPHTDIPLLAYLMSTPDPEAGTCRVLQALIRPGDHVIDVGANVGILTLAMARAIGAEGEVLAVEPSPGLCEALRQTVIANGLASKVSIEAVAAADREGSAELFIGGTSGWSSLTPLEGISGGAVEVPLRTLDSLVEPGSTITVAKIDVEGSELLVLAGMTRIMSENPNIALVVEFGPTHIARNQGTIEDWLAAFREKGFTSIFEIDEATGACTPARGANELASVVSVNLLMTRRGSDALARLGLA
jgi:FkbM family methyltransferase